MVPIHIQVISNNFTYYYNPNVERLKYDKTIYILWYKLKFSLVVWMKNHVDINYKIESTEDEFELSSYWY